MDSKYPGGISVVYEYMIIVNQMATFQSFNDACFCEISNGCHLLKCGHGIHLDCSNKLSTCPWCRENIVFMQPSIQAEYVRKRIIPRLVGYASRLRRPSNVTIGGHDIIIID